jgi:hypothetical protein
MTHTTTALGFSNQKFPLGPIYFTESDKRKVVSDDVWRAVFRHRCGDWGDLNDADKASNDGALESGGRLTSAYENSKGVKFWITTEADLNSTSVFVEDDY